MIAIRAELPPQPRQLRKHGLSYTPEYRAWQTMRLRCTDPSNPAYPDYGGRGISVCERWMDSPEAFISDMGTKPSQEYEIDRINNHGNYEPGNCRWTTRKENCRNRRSTIWVSFRGERRVLCELCEQFGTNVDACTKRLLAGWSVEDAVTTPVREKSDNGTLAKVASAWRARIISVVSSDWASTAEVASAACTAPNAVIHVLRTLHAEGILDRKYLHPDREVEKHKKPMWRLAEAA
jgi:hypothetical protein